MSDGIKVLLADDQPLMSAGIALILETAPDITVVGQATNGLEAITLAQRRSPNVICLDVQMPVMDGLEACNRLRTGSAQILMLTTFAREDYLVEALTAGACGYLPKMPNQKR